MAQPKEKVAVMMIASKIFITVPLFVGLDTLLTLVEQGLNHSNVSNLKHDDQTIKVTSKLGRTTEGELVCRNYFEDIKIKLLICNV